MALLRTYTLPSVWSLVTSGLGDFVSGSVIRRGTLASPSVGLAAEACPCACCDIICELNLGTIVATLGVYGDYNFTPTADGWLADPGTSGDDPADNEYKAFISKETVDGICESTVYVFFGLNSVDYLPADYLYPGARSYGPYILTVNALGEGDCTIQYQGALIGTTLRAGLEVGTPVGTYEATLERPTGDPGDPTVPDDITIEVPDEMFQVMCGPPDWVVPPMGDI